MTTHLRLSSSRTQVTNVDKDVEKRDPSYSAGGVPAGVATMGNSMEVSQKTNTAANVSLGEGLYLQPNYVDPLQTTGYLSFKRVQQIRHKCMWVSF